MAYSSWFNALGSITRETATVTTVDLSTNQTSGVFSATNGKFNFSYQFYVVSGTPTGSFIVEVSNDPRCYDSKFVASARFETAQQVDFTAGVAPNGSAGCAVVVQNAWMFSRCRWVFSANTGTGWCLASGMTI